MRGETILHYRITDRLGAGSMGVVYRAEDTRLDRTVALKFLSPELTEDALAKQRFLREARAAASLDHEYICTIHDVTETADGRLFIVMAHYEGQILKDRIAQGPLPAAEAATIALQCARGLAVAHNAGIVHRDIKPGNILVTTAGKVKILDFGLAKLAGSLTLTRTGTMMGTARYLSPEQARGDEVDERADIWSLGAVLFEMLAGYGPFKGDYEQAVIYQIINGEPEPLPRTLAIDPKLVQIIDRCLAKNPRDRYQSATDLARDLERVLAAPAHQTSASGSASHPEKPRRRRLRTLSVGALALGAIIVAMVLLMPTRSIPFTRRGWILITDFENQTGEDIFQGTVSEALSIDLQQSQYVNLFTGKRLSDALFRSGRADATFIDAALGREIAIREGVTAVLEGKISRVGDTYTLSAKLVVPTTGEAVDTKRVRVHSREDFLSAVDELSLDIRRNLGESMQSIRRYDQPLAEVTTQSLPALRYYTLSQQHSRAAHWQQAITILEQAVAIDSTFATALNDLAVLNHNLRRITDALDYSERAYRYRDRVTERERYHVEGEYFRIREEFAAAIGRYRLLLQLYPDDLAAANNLAYTYIYTRQYSEAKDYALRLEEADPESWYALQLLGLASGGLAAYDEAVAYFRAALRANPQAFWSHASIAMVHAINGRWPEAWAELDESLAEGVEQDALRLGFAALLHTARGDYRAAAETYESSARLFRSRDDRSAEAADLRNLARIQAALGEQPTALSALERAVTISPTAGNLAEFGRQQAQSGLVDAARATADRLAKLSEAEPTMGNLSAYHRLRGEMALAAGHAEQACDEFALALTFADRLETHFALGIAHSRNGDQEQAREQFTLVAESYWATFFDGYPELHALSLYELGNLSEAADAPGQAAEFYAEFLALWGDRGGDRPEVQLVRQKL